MHDALSTAYETFVIDDPDEPAPPIAIGRVSTEDLVAHVLVMGQRHRRTPDLKETSCGVAIHSEFYPPMREMLTNRDTPSGLCTLCFTPHELLRAMQNDADAVNAEDEADKRRDALADQRKRKADESTTSATLAMRRKRPSSQGDR